MKKSEIYAKAVDVINELGWTQGRYVNRKTGEVCAVGAIRFATGAKYNTTDGYFEGGPSGSELDQYQYDAGVLHGFVPNWNDDPSRTKEDVLLYLKEKAYEYEQRGE